MRTLTVQGEVQRTDESWQVQDKLNQRATASFHIYGLQNLTGIDAGDEVVLMDDTTLTFAGCIDSVQITQVGVGLEYDLNCTDYTYLIGKRIVYGSYVSQTLHYILDDLITNFFAAEGISAGTFAGSYTLDKVVFSYISGTKALDQLAQATGLSWIVDYDKKLHFIERATLAAPFAIAEATRVIGLAIKKDKAEYRNRQYIRGGYGKTSAEQVETPTPKPDSKSRSFVVRYPVAEKPQVFINTVEVSASDIGVNGLDTGKKWYFSYNSNVITQDSGETVLADTDVLLIHYYGLYPILTVVEDMVEIADRLLNEPNTSGIYETLTLDSTLKSSGDAITAGNNLLLKYGRIPQTISFATYTAGLAAGQLLSITKSLQGLSGTYLIESVTTSPEDGKLIYDVTALDGAALGGWETFFAEMKDAGKASSIVIGENEVLIIAKVFQDNAEIYGEWRFAELENITCGVGVKCGFTLGSVIWEEYQYDQ